jgi:membrane-associated protein
MELLSFLVDLVLHLDQHLVDLLTRFDVWIYAILFAVIFAETGLVVTPFLPGDSLLFAVGALAAVDSSGTLQPLTVWVLLCVAAILGNTTNYAIGSAIGPRAFSGNVRFLKVDYLRRTEEFFDRHGGKTIILSRYVPIIRTFAPFVAGVGRMRYSRFQLHNVIGAVTWVGIFVWGGYVFGNIPLIKDNFGIVTILIIVLSLVPLLLGFRRRETQAAP